MTQAAGWYPDPAGKADAFRWWDGAAWTRFLSSDPDAPDPDAPDPDAPDPDADPGPHHDEPRVRLAVAVGSVVAVLLVAVVAVGAVVTASTRELPEGPAAPPAPPPAVTVQFDSDTRKAQVAEVSMTLPAEPYSCQPPEALAPTFSQAAICDAVVFADYQGTEDWYAGLGFGVLSADFESEVEVTTTARNVFDSLQAQFYAEEKTTPKNFRYQELNGIPSTRAVALTGQLHYAIEGLEPRFDKVLVIVVKLQSGDHVVCFSARPDGVPEPTLASLNASLDSFAITR